MGKLKRSIDSDDDVPRSEGAKSYKKPTLYKIINDCKPTNMLVWGTVAEQYRVQCGEMEARPSATIKKFFFQKMCDVLSLLQYLANGFERDDWSGDVEINYAADV
jgi:hypothetical protein